MNNSARQSRIPSVWVVRLAAFPHALGCREVQHNFTIVTGNIHRASRIALEELMPHVTRAHYEGTTTNAYTVHKAFLECAHGKHIEWPRRNINEGRID